MWIKTSEKPPEDSEMVIFVNTESIRFWGVYKSNWKIFCPLNNSDRKPAVFFFTSSITHWMPVPKLPEE